MTGGDVLEITLRTLAVGVVSTLAILPFGVALAYLLARRRFPGKSLVQTLIALPMALPPVAVGLVLLVLFSRENAFGEFFASTLNFPVVFTWRGAAVAAAVLSFPILVRSVEQAFAAVPQRLEHLGATLGLGRRAIFFRITLPLARRGVAYGALLAFVRGLGEFGATSLLAGNIPGSTETLALGIYSRVSNGENGAAMILMLVSLALAFGAMWCAEAYLRQDAGGAPR